MSDVISFEKARAERRKVPDPLQEFGAAWDDLMMALDFIEKAPRTAATQAAYKAVHTACTKLLAREERIYAGWTR